MFVFHIRLGFPLYDLLWKTPYGLRVVYIFVAIVPCWHVAAVRLVILIH